MENLNLMTNKSDNNLNLSLTEVVLIIEQLASYIIDT